MQQELLLLPTAVSQRIQLRRGHQAGTGQRYHFRLHWRSNLSRPSRIAQECGIPVGHPQAHRKQVWLPSVWLGMRSLPADALLCLFCGMKGSRYCCWSCRSTSLLLASPSLSHAPTSNAGGNSQGRKSPYAFFTHHSKAGVRRRLKATYPTWSSAHMGKHVGTTKCCHWSYPANIPRSNFSAQLIPQYFTTMCKVPWLF